MPELVGSRTITNDAGGIVTVGHILSLTIDDLVQSGQIDCLIIECEQGFSQLGQMEDFLTMDLGLATSPNLQWEVNGMREKINPTLRGLSDWSRYRSPEVTFVGIQNANPNGLLKGIVLSPYEGSRSYTRFSAQDYIHAFRDFYYNVSYETIKYAAERLKATRLAITHLSREKYRGVYKWDVTACQIEALQHFLQINRSIESFSFLDVAPGNKPLEILDRMSHFRKGIHRPISLKSTSHQSLDFVDLEWPTHEPKD
jgi:hypothetical protein